MWAFQLFVIVYKLSYSILSPELLSVSFFFCAISGFVQALSKHFVMIFLSCFSVFLLLPCTNNKYDLVLGSIFSCLAGLINNIFILFFRHVHLQFCHLLKIYIQGISRMIFKVLFIFGLKQITDFRCTKW